ncbi:molybdate transport system substrate-binding protein [Mariprofundus micogutta]|uniref:Molybdate transport system substrate-binding protein n=1 Tax=Mariprofundus micogutta TaxID=1921010 RepID=A0A1L8CQI0_9PROT|nr:molybdate ABC transporter substrate-binding protein [Mariprofundus micogutta]GAV21134.1 molybdate transport system substrate-binding protein [Mariprofundus micogutta]
MFTRIYLLLILLLFPAMGHAEETITVAVASSLYPAMKGQAARFEKEHAVQVRLISGSTGRLYNQIVQGAPFDLFIAADDIRPARLIEQGRVFAEGGAGLGYLGVKSRGNGLPGLEQLTISAVQRIVLPNPDVAPFGQAAKEALKQQGLWEVLSPKFVYAQNAMQASLMVDQGLVDAGFVPVTLSESAIASISYRAVMLTERAAARQLLKYVTAKEIEIPSLLSAQR